MELLVFAHPAEARAFRDDPRPKLICGEGLLPAATKLAAALGELPEVDVVSNFGVAGILADHIEPGKVYPVRTIYAEGEFHSFTCEAGEVDLISSRDRVRDEKTADHLENFAPLVDREAWALAQICRLMGRRFFCYKVAADRPGEEGDACAEVRAAAESYSRALAEHKPPPLPRLSASQLPARFSKDPWHFSVSMRRRLEHLWERAPLGEEALRELESRPLSPKERSAALLDLLGETLHPRLAAARERLDPLLEVFENARADYDKTLERPELRLRAELASKEQAEGLRADLAKFDWESFRGVFRV